MIAYAQYYSDDGLEYRLNTHLFFGTEIKHIGNIALINPGSALPIKVSNDTESALLSGVSGCNDNWHEFRPDSTMRFIEKIFNGTYVGKKKKLNGYVKLFNLFNLRNQNLSEALTKHDVRNPHMYSEDCWKHFNNKPTYFGWGNTTKDIALLNSIAQNIYSNTKAPIRSQKKEYDKGTFYHPMYINRSSNQKHFQWYKEEVLHPFATLIN